MDVEGQRRVREMLEASMADGRLDRAEAASLGEALAGLGDEPTALDFVRNEAFRLARDRSGDVGRPLLQWLERVVREVARARHGAAPPPHEADAVAFGPGDACHRLVLATLRTARQALDVCVYTITDDRIADALLSARRRGVRIRILTDDEKTMDLGSDIERLSTAGIPVETDDTPDFMHHKFAVVDASRLIHGSFNWTRGAARNFEDVHVTTSRSVVSAYATEFERLWQALAPRT